MSTHETYASSLELARAVATEVHRHGGDAYYVGGFVRDGLLGRPSKDVDIEVHGIDAASLEALLAQFGTVNTVGKSFGIYVIQGYDLEISLPRRIRTPQSASADLASITDPYLGTREASRRRDLTINALYEDVLTGEIIDYVGGRDDLARGVVRHVDDESFCEDPLRVMRVAQLAARLQMRVAPQTIELCARISIADLPRERVLEELRKALLKPERPSVFFEILRCMGQMDTWFGEVQDLVGVPQNPLYHPEGDVWAHTMMVTDMAARLREQACDPFSLLLSAVCHDLGKAAVTTTRDDGRIVSYGHDKAGIPLASALLKRLGTSTKTSAYVCSMVELHMAPNAFVAQHARQKSYNKLFDRSFCPHDLLLLARADDLGRGDDAKTSPAAEELERRLRTFEEIMERPYVRGSDLMELGIEPGPLMGEVLGYVHKLRLAGVQKDDQLRQAMGYWRGMQRKSD